MTSASAAAGRRRRASAACATERASRRVRPTSASSATAAPPSAGPPRSPCPRLSAPAASGAKSSPLAAHERLGTPGACRCAPRVLRLGARCRRRERLHIAARADGEDRRRASQRAVRDPGIAHAALEPFERGCRARSPGAPRAAARQRAQHRRRAPRASRATRLDGRGRSGGAAPPAKRAERPAPGRGSGTTCRLDGAERAPDRRLGHHLVGVARAGVALCGRRRTARRSCPNRARRPRDRQVGDVRRRRRPARASTGSAPSSGKPLGVTAGARRAELDVVVGRCAGRGSGCRAAPSPGARQETRSHRAARRVVSAAGSGRRAARCGLASAAVAVPGSRLPV